MEATRDDDAEKNRRCPPSPFPDTPWSWITVQVLGGRAVRAFTAEPDIKAWADGLALNPSRVQVADTSRSEVVAALARLAASAPAGAEGLARLAAL